MAGAGSLISQGLTPAGAGRRWPRAAPEQEVARSRRAGPTLEDLPPSILRCRGVLRFCPLPVLGGSESFVITGALSWGLALGGATNTGRVISWVGTALWAA